MKEELIRLIKKKYMHDNRHLLYKVERYVLWLTTILAICIGLITSLKIIVLPFFTILIACSYKLELNRKKVKDRFKSIEDNFRNKDFNKIKYFSEYLIHNENDWEISSLNDCEISYYKSRLAKFVREYKIKELLNTTGETNQMVS